MQSETLLSVKIMLKQTQQSSLFQKHTRWLELLSRCDPDHKSELLALFLDHFPFNYQQWLEYIELAGPQKYQVALKRNPKSYELWMKYLEYVKGTAIYQDQAKYKKQIEKAIMEIGADSRTGGIYIQYYGMLSENYRYQYFKKIFTRALTNLEQIWTLFQQWFDSKTEAELTAIAAKETKGRFTVSPQQLRTFLTQQIKQTYQKTIIYRKKRFQLQSQIQVWYFNGDQQKIEKDSLIWRELINLDRAQSTIQNTSYCYERMLMAQMHNIQLWQQLFHYLQNQTNKYAKVLNIFRFNKQFFLSFNTTLYFYWCDLQQRQNPSQARKMYLQLQKVNPKPQVFLQHIQFQIREKQWQKARTLYDSLLPLLIPSPQLLTFTLIQYSSYIIKYYKDHEYSKKLLHQYFEYLPYNSYLFNNYLAVLRNFQHKEGFYDQLMAVIAEGLRKARRVGDEEERRCVGFVKSYLRGVLGSIYLVRLSERRVMEVLAEDK